MLIPRIGSGEEPTRVEVDLNDPPECVRVYYEPVRGALHMAYVEVCGACLEILIAPPPVQEYMGIETSGNLPIKRIAPCKLDEHHCFICDSFVLS